MKLEWIKNEMTMRLDDVMEIVEVTEETLKVHTEVEYKSKKLI